MGKEPDDVQEVRVATNKKNWPAEWAVAVVRWRGFSRLVAWPFGRSRRYISQSSSMGTVRFRRCMDTVTRGGFFRYVLHCFLLTARHCQQSGRKLGQPSLNRFYAYSAYSKAVSTQPSCEQPHPRSVSSS